MRWGLALVIALTACGRGRFDLRDDSGTRDGTGDTAGGPCQFTSVALGEATTCATDQDGGVWCWGRNTTGQAVPPSSSAPLLAGARVPLPAASVEIGVGKEHSCALLVDNTVWCWGDNTAGQLGNGTTAPSNVPTQVQLGGEAAVELDVGGVHACVRRGSDNGIMCWGHGKAFALGNTTITAQPTPMFVAGTALTTQLAVGHRHACGIDPAGEVYCWGKGGDGQLGIGNADSATIVRPGVTNVLAIDASNRVTCVVLAGGGARCWGSRYLGGPNFDRYPNTVYVPGAKAVTTAVYAGCAIEANDTVTCWGYLYDQVPAGLTTTPTPLAIADVISIHGGWYHYCAITAAGLVCWGDNGQGQLGQGNVNEHQGPAPVAISCDAT